MQSSEKLIVERITTTKFERKLLADLFDSSAKVSKLLNNVLRSSNHFTSAEMELLTRLATLFSEISRRPKKEADNRNL